MNIEKFVFNPFQVNCYIVYDDTGDCLIIDASCNDKTEKEKLVLFISERDLNPVMILNTHGHVDHLSGNTFLAEKYSIPLAIHRDDLFLVRNAVQQGLIFGFDIDEPPDPSVFLQEGEDVYFGNSGLNVFHAPGHSPGSVVFYSLDGKFLITGDVLFAGSIGRTDLPGGNYNVLMKSIKEKIILLPDDTLIYPGHGPASTIGNEKLNNPFLK